VVQVQHLDGTICRPLGRSTGPSLCLPCFRVQHCVHDVVRQACPNSDLRNNHMPVGLCGRENNAGRLTISPLFSLVLPVYASSSPVAAGWSRRPRRANVHDICISVSQAQPQPLPRVLVLVRTRG
jgi:hypothetical protein